MPCLPGRWQCSRPFLPTDRPMSQAFPGAYAVFRCMPAHFQGSALELTRNVDVVIRLGVVQLYQRHKFGTAPSTPRLMDASGLVRLNLCVFPPWLNTVMFVHDASTVGYVSFPGWMRRRLLHALSSAGVAVQQTRRIILNNVE